MKKKLPVTDMFKEMIQLGQITPKENMEDMRFPGELNHFATYASYGTQDIQSIGGITPNAELDKRT